MWQVIGYFLGGCSEDGELCFFVGDGERCADYVIQQFQSRQFRQNMNTKYLIETLTEIPDSELLQELSSQIIDKPLMLPNLTLLFKMFHSLFSCSNPSIKLTSIILYQKLLQSSNILNNEIENGWNLSALSIIRMIGEQDSQIRKKSSSLLFAVIDRTNNANVVLERLYYDGIQNQSILVMIQSIKQCYKILEAYTSILQNKTGINIMKLILQKIITLVLSNNHIQLQKAAREFLNKLFYLKIERLDDVLIQMNEHLLEKLQKIWAYQKEQLLLKQAENQQKQNKIQINQIKYEHLPLINGKFFNIYEPYILKNIFNPEMASAKKMAIKHFREGFEAHEHELQKYLNIIFKILVKFLHEEHYDLLFMLKKIVMMSGITNIVNLAILPQMLIRQLETDVVIYRRDLREILKKMNYSLPEKALQAYREEIETDQTMDWIKLLQILQLLQHWIDSNLQKAYPPALDPFLGLICRNLSNSQTKIKEKSLQLLLALLDRYPGYRENLQQIFTEQQIGDIEDIIEKRKTKGKINPIAKQAQQIFMKEYQEERTRFLAYKNKR